MQESELELEVTESVSDNSEFSVGDSHRKFVFEEEWTCELECVIWWDFYSFCVEIRC
jgi:hypothetical protein